MHFALRVASFLKNRLEVCCMKPQTVRTLVKAAYAAIIIVALIPAAALANSSWQWFDEDPTSLLPIAIVGTLAIEMLIVFRFGGVPRKALTLAIGAVSIIAANLISYVLPYILGAMSAVSFYGIDRSEAMSWYVSKGPFYIIVPMSLILTLICEYPIVYFSMRWAVKDRKALIRAIIIANVITTASVALMERMLVKGSW